MATHAEQSSLLEMGQVETRAGAPTTTRVLHLINGEHYAGAERVQDLLAARLPEFGFEVSFVTLKRGQFAELRQSQQAPLFETPMRSRIDVTLAPFFARLVKYGEYALIHSHTPRTALVGRMASVLAGVPHVHHLHSPATADTDRPWRNRCNSWVERLSLRGASGVIAVSHSLGQYARRRGISDGRLSVVPNGVARQGVLAPRERPHSRWTLGVVALFRPRKGMEVLLEALALLRHRGVPAKLRAVGRFETAAYEAFIHSEAARLQVTDAIEWVGFSRDIPRQLAQMDLLVLPSLYGEGLPMVVLEAMAAGVPVVATRVEGVPEAIRDGVDGMLADAADATDLARAIQSIITGQADWSQLRTNAHLRQAALFSDLSMAAGVAEVYRRVLAGRLAGAGLGTRGSGLGARDSGLGTRGSGLGARDSGLGTRGLETAGLRNTCATAGLSSSAAAANDFNCLDRRAAAS